MNTTATTSPEITRAAERYLEQYGDPLVMNTYLKITVLVLAVVCLALAGLTYKSQRALTNMRPSESVAEPLRRSAPEVLRHSTPERELLSFPGNSTVTR